MPQRKERPAREADLYGPIRDYLVAQGYTVRAEVHHCDIAAVRGDDLILIELKRTLSVSLLIQAVRRQRVGDSVYIAAPESARMKRLADWRGFLHLLRRLELGLILVRHAPRPAVTIVQHPQRFDRKRNKAQRRALLEEAAARSGDYNIGGSTRRKLVTAYRENAIQVACYLRCLETASPKNLRALGTGPKTLAILYHNVYGWFSRTGRGQYSLTPAGIEALGEYPELTARYEKHFLSASAIQPDVADAVLS